MSNAKDWAYEAPLYKAAIGPYQGGSTPLAVYDRATLEPLQFVVSVHGMGKLICDEWDVRIDQWSRR